MTDQQEQPTAEQHDANFLIQRIYVKDSSYEAPLTPQIFQETWEPQLTIDLQTYHTALDNDIYEVVLAITATVKNHDKVAFLVEIKQAGIFTIQGTENDQLQHLLGSFCPNILFPYAREAITSQVLRGSFPQLVLSPINFDALFFQQLEEKAKALHQTAESTH